MSIEERPNRPSPYKVRIRTPDGRQVTKSFRRRLDAERWERAQLTDMTRGEWVDPRAGAIRLSEWLDEVEASKINLSEETRKTRASLIANHLKAELGNWPIGKLTAEEIQRFITGRSQTHAPATVHKIAVILSEALRLAVARGRLVRSPYIEIELPGQRRPPHRYLTEREVARLHSEMSPRYRPLVLLGAYGGLRPGESVALEWGDLDGRVLRIRGTKTAGSRRAIRVPQFVVDSLTEHRQAFPHLRLVLHNRAGRPVDLDHFRARQWAAAVEAAKVGPMTPHDLRHTHVALLIAEGMHAKGISDRLGHTSIRTTMDTYGHLLEGVEADVVDRLGEEWPEGDGTQEVPNEEEPPSEEDGSGL